MSRIIRRSVLSVALALVAAGHLGVDVRAAGDDLSYRVASGEVIIVCPLTLGGSFEARTKDVSGEVTTRSAQPGTIEGTFSVNLQTLETGIGLRDRHMRENYLEVQKGPQYAVATLEQIRVERLDGRTTLKGTLLLHGERKEISGSAELKQRGDQVTVRAQFPVRVSDFAIPQPSYLGVGVRDEIQVKVSMIVSPMAVTQSAGVR